MAKDLQSNKEVLQIALIEVPPYVQGTIAYNSICKLGKLGKSKKWFITTPSIICIQDLEVLMTWEGEIPDFDFVLSCLAKKFVFQDERR